MPAVKTLEAHLSNVTLQRDPSLTPGTITLVIGSSYQGVVTSPSTSPKHHKRGINRLTKSLGGISGSASCQSDTRTFVGANTPTVP
jgi:hypothetical protein